LYIVLKEDSLMKELMLSDIRHELKFVEEVAEKISQQAAAYPETLDPEEASRISKGLEEMLACVEDMQATLRVCQRKMRMVKKANFEEFLARTGPAHGIMGFEDLQ